MSDEAMNDREARLAKFLAKDGAPARDYVFEARVAFARRKQRIIEAGLTRSLWLASGLVVLWAVMSGDYAPDSGAWTMILAAAVIGGSAWLVRRQFRR